MPKAKVAGRQSEDRPTTSARVYVDTVVKLKFLADLDNVSLSEAIDRLVVEAFGRRKAELHQAIDALAKRRDG
jgi:hypothetical protein